MTKSDYIRAFIVDNDFWTMPSRTLAKAVLSSNPKMFGEYNDENIDATRSLVRRIRYSLNLPSRQNNGEFLGDKMFAEKYHGYIEPELNDYTPFEIPDSVT